MFPFVAGGGLYYLAPAAELLARVLANIAHLHIINKTIASPALHETKFLIHIISFNKGSYLPLWCYATIPYLLSISYLTSYIFLYPYGV